LSSDGPVRSKHLNCPDAGPCTGSEIELLALAQRGDLAAFEDLARAHRGRVFAVALAVLGDPADAEDVVQETLLRAWRGMRGFRRNSSLRTWLHRIAVNEANRALERTARRLPTVDLTAEQLRASSPPDHGPAQQAEYRELRAAFQKTLLALPPAHRSAVLLRDVEGLSTREAADITGIGEAAFKSRLHQARLKMRAGLGGESGKRASLDQAVHGNTLPLIDGQLSANQAGPSDA
jgi:RNA polymerase sigma-70 factor (ECF subfamily)